MSKKQSDSVCVVVVTYNSAKTIMECLYSLMGCIRDCDKVVIVDNASTDLTVDVVACFINRGSKKNITLIKNKENLGYSEGANIGARQRKDKDYILFLNPDTVVYPGFLEKMIDRFKDPQVAAVGPVSNYVAGFQNLYNMPNYIRLHKVEITTEELSQCVGILLRGQTLKTKMLIGFCLMVKADVWKKIGEFDKDLWFGNDDLDYSWRLTTGGYHLAIALDCFVYHLGQGSLSDKSQLKPLIQQSTDALYEKLCGYYNDNPPDGREIWGIDWFSPSNPKPKPPPKLSLCMIVKNEEQFLQQCLDSVKDLVDEIIVVDTGSTDKTKWIAMGQGAIVCNFEWNDNFSDARNFGIERATGDWILVLDADEVLKEGSGELIKSAITNPIADAYELFFINPTTLNNDDEFTEHRICRLFKNKPEFRFQSAIHENIELSIAQNNGVYTYLEAYIIHYGYAAEVVEDRGKQTRYIDMLKKEVESEPDNLFYLHHLAMAYVSYNQFDKAVPYLEHLVDIIPNESSFCPIDYANLINALTEIGEKEKALEYADRAEEKGIRHPQLYFCKGKVLAAMEKWEKSIEAYEQCLVMGEGMTWNGDTTIIKYKADLAIAVICKEIGIYDKAIFHAQKVLQNRPNFFPVYGMVQECYNTIVEDNIKLESDAIDK
jgi:GT2 family glycosyltransferase